MKVPTGYLATMEGDAKSVFAVPLVRHEGDASSSLGWLGGHPRGITRDAWPECAVCSHPMCHLGQFNAVDGLDLGPYRRMSLFICHATGGSCEDWEPRKGSNRVLLHETLDDNLYDGPPTVRIYRRALLGAAGAADEKSIVRSVAASGGGEAAISAALRYDKLGGYPAWYGRDQTPHVHRDAEPMRMVLQLTPGLVGLDITPTGVLWVFIDASEGAPGGARMLWQTG